MKDASSGIGLESRVLEVDAFRIATIAVTVAAAVALAWLLTQWPPHEDETLALFLGRDSLGEVLRTVVTERGGAPLHFFFAWAVVHLGGGLTELRLVSLAFAVASVPLIALLGARLVDRRAGVVAAALASASWVFLFHGIYARMYSLFLFASLLSFLALLRGAWPLWGISLLVLLATHPYALLVIAAQLLFVLLRRTEVRPALLTLAVVAVVGFPFWWADVVLRNRFDVGVGGGGSPLRYLYDVSRDFSAPFVVLLAVVGAVLLAQRRRESALLTACVLGVPALALAVATLRSSASLETRHLIFVLPFFSLLLAVALVALPRLVAIVAVAALLCGEVAWAYDKTPQLFRGDPAGEARARDSAAAWLASHGRQDDVLLGYEPVYLRAWEQHSRFSQNALPRADPVLLAAALNDIPEPLGHGVWVFDASDTTNARERQTIRFVLPAPAARFEGAAFGPYLVIRSRDPLETRERYVAVAEDVMRLGRKLQVTDADINLHALLLAESRL
jgi:hypothetical protein